MVPVGRELNWKFRPRRRWSKPAARRSGRIAAENLPGSALANQARSCRAEPVGGLSTPHSYINWSLTSLQKRLVKTGGRLVKHARYYWLLLAESHLTRRLFGAMLGRIARLPVPTG